MSPYTMQSNSVIYCLQTSIASLPHLRSSCPVVMATAGAMAGGGHVLILAVQVNSKDMCVAYQHEDA